MATRKKPEEDGRATRWDGHRVARRVSLVQAAIDAIEAEGPGVGIDHIAERAGIARPAFYRHFEDAAGLQRAVFERATEMLLVEFAPLWAKGSTTPGALVGPTVLNYFRWMSEHPNLSRYCLRHAASHSVNNLRMTVAQRMADVLQGVFGGKDMSRVNAQVLAVGIVGLTESTVVWWLENPKAIALRPLAAMTARMIFDMIRSAAAEVGVVVQDDGRVMLPAAAKSSRRRAAA